MSWGDVQLHPHLLADYLSIFEMDIRKTSRELYVELGTVGARSKFDLERHERMTAPSISFWTHFISSPLRHFLSPANSHLTSINTTKAQAMRMTERASATSKSNSKPR